MYHVECLKIQVLNSVSLQGFHQYYALIPFVMQPLTPQMAAARAAEARARQVIWHDSSDAVQLYL